MPRKIDLIGKRFGRLVVLGCGQRKANGRITWRCSCDCGKTKDIAPADLRHGGTQSCGCLKKDANVAMGAARFDPNARRNTGLYRRWTSMLQRCKNPDTPFFKNYGGRGIFVCDRWLKYENFAADIGDPPSPDHTIERIDNDGPYSPSNCRWALRSAQLRNRRNNITITLRNETMIAKDWAKRCGIPYQRLTYAFRTKGIDAVTQLIAEAIT